MGYSLNKIMALWLPIASAIVAGGDKFLKVFQLIIHFTCYQHAHKFS